MTVAEIEGVGEIYADKLREVGIRSIDALLQRGATRHGRHELAQETGIRESLLLEWVNHADLMRIDGVGPEFADLLEAAGVDSCAELAQRNATNLATTFAELDAARETVRRLPHEAVVARWIEQAKRLPKVVEH